MKKSTNVIASICFALVLFALLTALVSDGVIIGQQILGFVLALFVGALTFIFGIILMIVSIMFIFGIIILQDYGFWPLEWSHNAFKEVLADYPVTHDQIQALLIIRIVLLVICLVVLIMSIIALSQIKKAKKEDPTVKVKPAYGLASVARFMSLLGLFVGAGALVILIAIL